MFERGHRRWAAAAVLAAAATGAGAYAAVPGGSGAIDGCYWASGLLRVVDTEAD
jgi:hypothetical protein